VLKNQYCVSTGVALGGVFDRQAIATKPGVALGGKGCLVRQYLLK